MINYYNSPASYIPGIRLIKTEDGKILIAFINHTVNVILSDKNTPKDLSTNPIHNGIRLEKGVYLDQYEIPSHYTFYGSEEVLFNANKIALSSSGLPFTKRI